jgi:hypothetical protein
MHPTPPHVKVAILLFILEMSLSTVTTDTEGRPPQAPIAEDYGEVIMLRLQTSSFYIIYVLSAMVLSLGSLIWLGVVGMWYSGSVVVNHTKQGFDVACTVFWVVEVLLTLALTAEVGLAVYLSGKKVK